MAEGFLLTKGNAELAAEEKARAEAQRAQAARPALGSLAAHVKTAFEEAKQYRDLETTARLLDCKRRRDGEYDAEKLAQIEQRGGPASYFNITDTKGDALESWLQDVFTKFVDSPWSLEPTPVPDLPDDKREEVIERVVSTVNVARAQGEPFPGPDIVDLTDKIRDGILKELRDDAKKRASRMSVKIEDQLVEGGFDAAFDDMVKYLATYPAGILKGPVIENVQRMKWGTGGVEVTTEPIPRFYAVSPFDFYPGPNARTVNDSYICETLNIARMDLRRMKGMPGYSDEAIDAVTTQREITPITDDSERDSLEGHDSATNSGVPSGALPAVEFWGAVPGSMLIDWGMDKAKVSDPLEYYEITAILIGDHVVKAILNPDVLGARPYFVTAYITRGGELYGDSIPEKMKNEQDAANACQRNLLSNLAIASGPQSSVNLDALDQQCHPTKVYPFKVWQYHGDKTGSQKVVDWFQPQINAAELLRVSEHFEQKCDDRTQIPRYTYGNENVGGAGQTFGGLNMLMNAAAKGIKRTVKNIDRDIVRPMIENLYRWNLINLPDEEYANAKGDCRVVPRGAIAAIIREQTQQKRLDFLNLTNNQVDMQIIGILGRSAILRKIAEELDLDVSEIVPDTEELIARLQEEAAQAAEQAMQQPDGAMLGAGNEPQAPTQPGPAPTHPEV